MNDSKAVEHEQTQLNTFAPVIDELLLPEVIHGQISQLNDLNVSVQNALKEAALAEDLAQKASNQDASFWSFSDKKKEAIESLQKVSSALAKSAQTGAKVQKISFDFQTRLAAVTKYLFGLGVSNIAANRSVVRELELRLKGASEAELSELARQEILLVIKQLKEHEDLLKKQEQTESALKNLNEKVNLLFENQNTLMHTIQASLKSNADLVELLPPTEMKINNLTSQFNSLKVKLRLVLWVGLAGIVACFTNLYFVLIR